MKTKLILILLLVQTAAIAQTTDNADLQRMYDEDQKARQGVIDWKALSKQDRLREQTVYEFIRDGKVVTGRDYYNTAMIFQHGQDTVSSAMAVKQMQKALELDTTINRWLLAAAIDRDLMRRKKPQIYGTQYLKMNNEPFKRYTIDSTTVTDAQRRYYRVETLAEQRDKERRMNLKSIDELYSESNPITTTIAAIREELKKGRRSMYDVGESTINVFGYELLNKKKQSDALEIFKLNTELYPQGYNTWDSYGECLMQMGKKEEGQKAYKRSLELNPKNEAAKKALKL